MYRCSNCKLTLPKSEFYKNNTSWCKECSKASARESSRKKRFSQYGITKDIYLQMLADQDGRCAICFRTEPGWTREGWAIDHDHACCPGKTSCGECVRGLLCASCNTALGHFGDSSDTLRRAADYLDQAPKP